MEVVFISQDKKAKFICTACQRQWEKDVSKYYDLKKQIKVKVNCSCGNSWSSVLEKRRHIRKPVSLFGTYTYTPPGRKPYEGSLEVLDISLKGLKIRLDREWDLKVNQLINVSFRLDNKAKKLINRQVIIKNMNKRLLGVAFKEANRNDPDIGFYLR